MGDKGAGNAVSSSETASSGATGSGGAGGSSGSGGDGGDGGTPCQNLDCACDFGKVGKRCSPSEPCTNCTCQGSLGDCDATTPDCETDLWEDPTHCGGCDVSCGEATGKEICSAGKCACSDGSPYCAALGGCAGSLSDPKNCGCGAYCQPGEVCVGGSCECAPGLMPCQVGCSNLVDDVENCGVCGNACGEYTNYYCGWTCVAGQCVSSAPICPAGKAFCDSCDSMYDDWCTDILSTTWHCGACDIVCPTGGPHTTTSCVLGQCQTVCFSAFADCNGDIQGDGCELQVWGDVNNCGGCGHSCSPGGCITGECTAYIITQAQTSPVALTLDATALYWANKGSGGPDGQIVRADKVPGAAPSVLVSGRVGPVGVIEAAGLIYWVETGHTGQSDGAVMAVPAGGGAPLPIASGQAYPLSLAKDGTSLYWTAHEGAALYSTPLGGAGPVTQVATLVGPRRIAVAGSYAYVTQLNGTLSRISLGAGTIDVLAAGLGDPWGLVVDDTNVYVRLAAGSIISVPIAGGAQKTLASNLDSRVDISLDGANLLYGSQTSLLRTSVVSGGKANVSSNPATAVAPDASALFWVDASSGVVFGVTR